VLRGGAAPGDDVPAFLLANLAFWLLAAIDGHAKNYSIFLRRHGHILTPLYDVISAWPIIGAGPRNLALQNTKLAMAVSGKQPHYLLDRIATRHWKTLAQTADVPFDRLRELVDRVPAAVSEVDPIVPKDFPEQVWETITLGLQRQCKRFYAGLTA